MIWYWRFTHNKNKLLLLFQKDVKSIRLSVELKILAQRETKTPIS